QNSLSTRLAKLNPEQRNAVETIEGPVMVIAGPGTGKTETLGARIANILQKTDSDPHNILCLTYTNAGVVAMRKRLLEFIGPDAQKVEIHTFHSFCNKVIQENPEIFSQTRDEENISPLEQHEILDEILDNLPTSSLFFSHNNSYFWSDKLLNFFGVLKSEKWTPEMVREKSQEFLDSLPENSEFQYKRKYTNKKTGETFQKGDINPAKIKKEDDKIQKLREALEISEKYSEKMKELGKYDFNDMILWVLEKFSTSDSLLAEYQEQFQYILVDEFQDTNGSQKELIDHLISYWESPNIFVVGDDDQSIYRFQGANMRNILEFFGDHKEAISTITLTKNYRSTQKILDTAEAVIARNSERLVSEISGLSKHLTAENDKNPEISPTLTAYYNEMHEQLGVFNAIKKLHESGENLSKTAVIYKNHRQAENIIALCEHAKIPLRVKENQNILELPLTKFILEMLKYFQAEKNTPFSGESILYKMMYFPFWKIDQHDIALVTLKLRENSRKNHVGADSICPEISEEQKHLKTLLLILDKNREFFENLKNPEALKTFAETIVSLEGFAQTRLQICDIRLHTKRVSRHDHEAP
ncbi:TPA: ATP-dependent helicase, partial [Candidatus Peregrinibacteria bacterium]|nr:ATP-dependent helicase [Candidatus Peregrinibacteria bacterium]